MHTQKEDRDNTKLEREGWALKNHLYQLVLKRVLRLTESHSHRFGGSNVSRCVFSFRDSAGPSPGPVLQSWWLLTLRISHTLVSASFVTWCSLHVHGPPFLLLSFQAHVSGHWLCCSLPSTSASHCGLSSLPPAPELAAEGPASVPGMKMRHPH